MKVIDLDGDPQTRGKALGASRRGQIQAFTADWLNSLRTAGITDPRAYIDTMLRDTDFPTAIRQHAPDLLEEVRCIAVGATHPFELVLAAQLMDEEWAYRSRQRGGEALQKCSSVAIQSQLGMTWIGQNMDLGGYTDGHQILLRIAGHLREPGALILTIGGMIGLLGVNAHGVGICVNSLPALPSAGQGLPVAFVIRKLLQAPDAGGAVRMLQAVPHATGQHYLIADPVSIRSFEASPAGVTEYHSPNPSRVLHTNHPLAAVSADTSPALSQIDSIARLRSLTDRLMNGNSDLSVIQAALSSSDDPDHPVCRVLLANGRVSPGSGLIGFTTGSMISSLRQGSRTIDSWVSAGPPSLRGYTQVRLQAADTKPEKKRSPAPSFAASTTDTSSFDTCTAPSTTETVTPVLRR